MSGRPIVTLAAGGLALVLVAIAYMARFDIAAHPNGLLILDRWSGTVSFCTTQTSPNGTQLGAMCRQTFPAYRTSAN